MVPTLTKEEFDRYINYASSFGVWVQIGPIMQRCLEITKEQAIDLVEDHLSRGPIWGMYTDDGRLELGLTWQWMQRLGE